MQNSGIRRNGPVVCIATKDPSDPSSVLKYEKTLSNIQEVTARGGPAPSPSPSKATPTSPS